MNNGLVLVSDPIGGDMSVITDVMESCGCSTIAARQGESWLDLAHLADALIVNQARIDTAALGRLNRCRVIGRLGVGTNNIDLEAARARGITVTNVPDYCREEVSDHALALMLATARKLNIANLDVQSGNWNQLAYRPIRRLKSLTLGLIGFGRLAQAVARKARGFGMKVVAHDPFVKCDPENFVELLTLPIALGVADVISLHVPLTEETRGFIGREEIARMKYGAILINTSRGELVDEEALVAALDEGRISAAALDVFAREPPHSDSKLRGRPNVLLTPHIAFYSEESLADLQRIASEDVALVLLGRAPRYRVV